MVRAIVTVVSVLSAALLTVWPARASVVATKHNLSASGPGPIKTFGEDEICIFCHAPHNASPVAPLWNHVLPTFTYELYASSTLVAAPGQPTGSSKLCLSCHDGTIALGAVVSGPPIPLSETLSGRGSLETDLSDDHPISFTYDSALAAMNPELVDPLTLQSGPVSLDKTDQLQCTTCHDPHLATYPKFLVMDGKFSALCTACHEQDGWTGSSHKVSPATWNMAGVDPWPHTEWTTVAANGCQSCHTPHAAGLQERLLNFGTEEGNCLSCHNGNVAGTDIEAQLQKMTTHPVQDFHLTHDPTEDFNTMARHVECHDCHDPHAVNNAGAVAPFSGGELTSVPGVTAQGTATASASFEYEVCFRCHVNDSSPTIHRDILQPNIRLKFQVSNPSFHPVEAPGQNPNVPSLLPPWTENSLVYCTDCHANDQGPGAGGSGPGGPHGSIWPFLLEREYTTTDGATESLQRYALCYKCHSRSSILNDESFEEHRKHIVSERASCAACHDPHGISSTQGNSTNNSHLINFNVDEVVPNRDGDLFFEDRGTFQGSCWLSCHGEDHRDENYGGGGGHD